MMKRFPFSFAELLAAVICLLLAAFWMFEGKLTDQELRVLSKLRQQMQNVTSGVKTFRLDCGRAPSEKEGLEILLGKKESNSQEYPQCARVNGYISREDLIDPWGNMLHLYTDPFEVVSYGADGVSGGGGVNQDISSRDVLAK